MKKYRESSSHKHDHQPALSTMLVRCRLYQQKLTQRQDQRREVPERTHSFDFEDIY